MFLVGPVWPSIVHQRLELAGLRARYRDLRPALQIRVIEFRLLIETMRIPLDRGLLVSGSHGGPFDSLISRRS
jgi:hypothetical protein